MQYPDNADSLAFHLRPDHQAPLFSIKTAKGITSTNFYLAGWVLRLHRGLQGQRAS